MVEEWDIVKIISKCAQQQIVFKERKKLEERHEKETLPKRHFRTRS